MQRKVCKLPKRLDPAARRGAIRTGRTRHRRWMPSGSAKLLAGRRSTQAKQGKKTAGVDGVTSLAPTQRLTLAQTLTLGAKAAPGRRVWRPQSGANARRPVGIPPRHDRALHALAHRGLDPAWAARLAPNSDGGRPGRAGHEAIEAICTLIGHKATDVVEADIEKGFDRIEHAAVLTKSSTRPRRRRPGKGWRQAGGYEAGQWCPTAEGTRPGGTLAPCMAHMARHGLATSMRKRCPRSGSRGLQAPTSVV